MRLVVPQDGEHCIAVSQKDIRCHLRGTDYEYSNCRVIVMKIDLDKTDIFDDGDNLDVIYVKGDQGMDRDTNIEIGFLMRGEYYVYVEFDWNDTV